MYVMKINKCFIKVLFVLCILFVFPIIPTFINVTTVQASVNLNVTEKTIYVGETFKIKINNTTEKVKWKSSKPKVASVNKTGKVTGKKAGKAKITATIGTKEHSCIVIVKERQVNYLSNYMVQSVSDENVYRVFFSLLDKSENQITATGNVEMRIENDGDIVYEDKSKFTKKDFDTWTSILLGSNLMCSIDIPKDKVALGNKEQGTLYLKVTGQEYEFEEVAMNISNLPKQINIEIPTDIGDESTPENRIEITKYNISDGVLFLSYKMTQVKNHKKTSFCTYLYEYDKNDNIISKDIIFITNMEIGSTDTKSIYLKDDTVKISIAENPEPERNIELFKTYIIQKGTYGENGCYRLKYTYLGYSFNIDYNKDKDYLDFVCTKKNELMMGMTINGDNTEDIKVDYINLATFAIADATIHPVTHTKDEQIDFVFSSKGIGIDNQESLLLFEANKYLELSFNGWEIILLKAGYHFSDIGFLAIE